MAQPVLADQQKLTFISSLQILDAVKWICPKRWPIETDDERDSKESVLSARPDNNDVDNEDWRRWPPFTEPKLNKWTTKGICTLWWTFVKKLNTWRHNCSLWFGFMAHQPFAGYLTPNPLYTYIRYMICKHILLITFLDDPEVFFARS